MKRPDVVDPSRAPSNPFWNRAERARTARGLSKSDVAKGARIGRTTYDRLEWQESSALPRTIQKIALTLEIPLSEALRLAGFPVQEEAKEKTPEDHLKSLLAQVPQRRRDQLERIHLEDRRRYEEGVERARTDYERSLALLEQLAQLSIDSLREEED